MDRAAAMIFERNEGGQPGCEWRVRYQEEVPIDHFTAKHKDKVGKPVSHIHICFHSDAAACLLLQYRMWWSFGFDGQPRELDYVMSAGTGFEPWVWYFRPDEVEADGRSDTPGLAAARKQLASTSMAGGNGLIEQARAAGLSEPDLDQVLDSDAPKQALLRALRTPTRYKQVFRFIENVRTEWKSDYFQYNFARYVDALVQTELLKNEPAVGGEHSHFASAPAATSDQPD